MKRNLFKILLSLLFACLAFTTMLTLTACGGGSGGGSGTTITDGDKTGGNGGNSGGGSQSGGQDNQGGSGNESGGNQSDSGDESGDNKGDETPGHSHAFNKQVVAEKYLKSAATCTAKAVYYFSCECGVRSKTETFVDENGEFKHDFDKNGVCEICGSVENELSGVEIHSNELIVNGDTISGKVSNDQSSFAFIDDIQVADGAGYVVCLDENCSQVALRKIVTLSVGDNMFYILVSNGENTKFYTVTIRRLPMFKVSFNTDGGNEIPEQQVEEGDI